MGAIARFAGTILVVAGTTLLVSHGVSALHAARPLDMPRDARFIPSGYDLRRNEPRGNWVACGTDIEKDADFCRVTDARGSVIYEGDFLPEDGVNALPASELKIAAVDHNDLWMARPSDATAFPAIPLVDGKVLVPVDEVFTAGAERASTTDAEQHRMGTN